MYRNAIFYLQQIRLEKSPDLKRRYAESIRADRLKGYARRVTVQKMTTGEKDPQWYLPHHPLINANKPENIRRVCNAAKCFCRVLLNKVPVPGPNLLSDLIGIFLRFRLFRAAFKADIEAMIMHIGEARNEQKSCVL